MRRFVKSYLVKRLAQYTVVNDDTLQGFEVWRYSAELGLTCLQTFPYRPSTKDGAREAALRRARELATRDKSSGVRPEYWAAEQSAQCRTPGASNGTP